MLFLQGSLVNYFQNSLDYLSCCYKKLLGTNSPVTRKLGSNRVGGGVLANVTFTPLHTSPIQTHSVEQGLSPHRDVESDVKVRLVTARVELDVSENHFCQ